VEKIVRDIRRATRRKFSAEDKIRIVLKGLRGEDSIVELYSWEGIAEHPCRRRNKARGADRCRRKGDAVMAALGCRFILSVRPDASEASGQSGARYVGLVLQP